MPDFSSASVDTTRSSSSNEGVAILQEGWLVLGSSIAVSCVAVSLLPISAKSLSIRSLSSMLGTFWGDSSLVFLRNGVSTSCVS